MFWINGEERERSEGELLSLSACMVEAKMVPGNFSLFPPHDDAELGGRRRRSHSDAHNRGRAMPGEVWGKAQIGEGPKPWRMQGRDW